MAYFIEDEYEDDDEDENFAQYRIRTRPRLLLDYTSLLQRKVIARDLSQ